MIGIVIVNYKNEKKTILYIKEELSKITIQKTIVVVNNGSTEESNNCLASSLNAILVTDVTNKHSMADCYIISNPENSGFAKGNNIGTEFIKTQCNAEYLLFTNNDIRFINETVVEELTKKLAALPDVSLIGPKVVGLKNENQSPEPYVSLWSKYVWVYLSTLFLTKKQKQKYFKLNYSATAKEGVHYKIMGSFFIVKTDMYVKCGMMDTQTFLFGEEVILSERLSQIGQYCYYYPEVAILHEHGATITKHINRKRKAMLQFESEAYYYRTYKSYPVFEIKIVSFLYRTYLMLKR